MNELCFVLAWSGSQHPLQLKNHCDRDKKQFAIFCVPCYQAIKYVPLGVIAQSEERPFQVEVRVEFAGTVNC